MTKREIERKFLVTSLADVLDGQGETDYLTSSPVEQGYIVESPEFVLRVRRFDDDGYLTIKGPKEGEGCDEIEHEIPLKYALLLLARCTATIKKTRYLVNFDMRMWEIDEFLNPELNGLIVAEIELEYEGQEIMLPPWVTTEVTSDHSYANSSLVKRLTCQKTG